MPVVYPTSEPMSFDLILLAIPATDSVNDVRTKVEELDARTLRGSGSPEHHMPVAQAIVDYDSRYTINEYYLCDLLDVDIGDDESRDQFKYIQLDGPADQKLAEILFHANHVKIHCYSGTSDHELEVYLRIICSETDYSVFDPQSKSIYRIGDI
jgi:hypothetical protein